MNQTIGLERKKSRNAKPNIPKPPQKRRGGRGTRISRAPSNGPPRSNGSNGRERRVIGTKLRPKLERGRQGHPPIPHRWRQRGRTVVRKHPFWRQRDLIRARLQDDDSQAGTRTAFGFFSTIRSIRPHFLASSGFMKKSRSIARSTASIGWPVCFV